MNVDLLEVIRRVAAAHNVQMLRVAKPFRGLENFDYGLRRVTEPDLDWQELGERILSLSKERTLVVFRDMENANYALFREPGVEAAYLVGPWRDPRSALQEAQGQAVYRYQMSMPVWSTEDAINVLEALVSMFDPDTPLVLTRRQGSLTDLDAEALSREAADQLEEQVTVEVLQLRYNAENRMLDAITRGDENGALVELGELRRTYINGFNCGPMSIKSKMLVLNALFRKAAEAGKVHPYYIDSISARFSARIERITSGVEMNMAVDMVRDYCACVRQHSVHSYSLLIQRVVNHIDLNLGRDLTLTGLASLCEVSPSYLSKRFKQEVGMNLVDYITSRRIQGAARLLQTAPGESVAAVAMEYGFMDTNYFSKTFKRLMGCTPTQYRREHGNAGG